MSRKVLYSFLLVIITFKLYSATITAKVGGGDWNVAGTWDCTCIPGAADDVIIPAGITVTTAVALTNFNSITITGTLNVSGGNLTISGSKTITVKNAGNLNVNGTNNLFLNNNNSYLIVEDGGSVLVTGNIDGNSTTWHYLNNYGFIEVDGNLKFETSITTNYSTGTLLIHGSIASAGSNLKIYNYGIVTVDKPLSMGKTNFYNYAGASFFVFGDFSLDNSSTFFNAGLIQCDNFTLGDINFVNATCSSNLSGTISTITSNTSVTGVGTAFSTELTVGNAITNSSNCEVIGIIASITDDTHLTLVGSVNLKGAYSTNTNINYGVSIPGTLITLGKFHSTGGTCPGCALKTMGNIYYQTYAFGSWCDKGSGSVLCVDWFLSQPQIQPISPGRRIWLAADHIGYGLGNDGDLIKRWFDLANTFGFYMAQATDGLKPILKNNATDNLNFNPMLSFSSGEKHLDLGTHYLESEPGAGGGISMFAVTVPASGSTGSPAIIDFGLQTTKGYGLAYSAQNAMAYTATTTPSGNGAQNSVIGHGRNTSPTLLSSTTAWTGNQSLFINGTSVSGPTSLTLTQLKSTEINEASPATATNGPFILGWSSTTSSTLDFEGNIGEIIVYANCVSTTIQESAQSFLALKYGITLTHAYRDYAGTIVRAIDATYNNDIAGLAREDLNVLHQKKSKSCNAGAELTISTAAINNSQYNQKLVSTNITNNRSYLIWGHNGNAANSGNRVYKITASNFKQQVFMQFAISGLSSAPILLVADDAAFTTNVNGIYGSYDGTYITYNTTFNNNTSQYFKLLIPSGTSTPGVLISETAPSPTIKNTAELQVYSTSKGVLLPALADTSSIAKVGGMIFYNTTHNRFMYYDANATVWKFVGAPLRQTQAVLSSSNGYYTGEIRYNLTSHTLWIWYDSAWHELNHN